QLCRELELAALSIFRHAGLKPDTAGLEIDLSPLERQDFPRNPPAGDERNRITAASSADRCAEMATRARPDLPPLRRKGVKDWWRSGATAGTRRACALGPGRRCGSIAARSSSSAGVRAAP